jgi:hypothetical protein
MQRNVLRAAWLLLELDQQVISMFHKTA